MTIQTITHSFQKGNSLLLNFYQILRFLLFHPDVYAPADVLNHYFCMGSAIFSIQSQGIGSAEVISTFDVRKQYIASVSISRFSRDTIMLFSSIGFFGRLISVTSNTPSSRLTIFAGNTFEPSHRHRIRHHPKNKIIYDSRILIGDAHGIRSDCGRRFIPSSRYAICPSTFFIS